MPGSPGGLRTGGLDWGGRERDAESDDGNPDAAVDGADPIAGDGSEGTRTVTHRSGDGAFGDLLDLLDDDYTHRILSALADAARPARELMEVCDASRATVYRRLDRLEEYGLVRSETELHAGGHHRKVFETSLERVTVDVGAAVPELRLVLDADPEADRTEAGPARPA